MPIYKPSELRSFLDGLGINPKKSLSQNFLIDGNIIKKIVSSAGVAEDDVVLEIGPGPGALTECLLDNGANVIAVEKDEVLAQSLQRIKGSKGHLEIYCQDILQFPLDTVLPPLLGKGKKAKVIANLPYHLTTPILVKLVQHNHLFSSLTVMVQEEVARRFCSQPHSSQYGSITVFLNFYTTPHYAFTVSKNCFFPIPKVESSIVILELKDPPKVSNVENFFEMTRTAFKHRRKMLRASLRDIYTPEGVMNSLKEMGSNPQARPEDLSINEFLRLFELLESHKKS